jgi:hypothetical protein
MINLRILGLYSTFIILIGSIVRDMVIDSQSKIMFSELPNVDRLLKLLSDILLVRSFNLLELELELYEKLIYIHRDPFYLIKISRKNKYE